MCDELALLSGFHQPRDDDEVAKEREGDGEVRGAASAEELRDAREIERDLLLHDLPHEQAKPDEAEDDEHCVEAAVQPALQFLFSNVPAVYLPVPHERTAHEPHR